LYTLLVNDYIEKIVSLCATNYGVSPIDIIQMTSTFYIATHINIQHIAILYIIIPEACSFINIVTKALAWLNFGKFGELMLVHQT